MIRLFTASLLLLVTISAFGQETDDYYRLPNHRRQYARLLTRYGAATVRQRWYAGLEGHLRTDRTTIDNTFNDLLSAGSVSTGGWGACVGLVLHERWAVEGGYLRAPVHNFLQIGGGLNPYTLTLDNGKNAGVLRVKYRLLPTGSSLRQSGLWLSGGAWLVPNTGERVARYSLVATTARDYRTRLDTMRITTDTQISERPSVLLETGAEYTTALGSNLELSFYGRKTWGLTESIRTDMVYTVNNANPRPASLVGSGNGWTFGVALRYSYGIRRTARSVYELQGK
jgi:hypothetical protein